MREGHIPKQEECEALLDPDNAKRIPTLANDKRRFQPRKHNMAKGALAPEDAAVCQIS